MLLQTKITMAIFKPKQLLAKPDDVKELFLGNVIGIANGIKKGTQADGVTPTQALAGNFEVNFVGQVDKNGAQPESVGAGVCYLSESFMNPMLVALAGIAQEKKDDKGNSIVDAKSGEVIMEWVTEPVKSVQFAYDVYSVRATNPQGYSWQLRSRMKVQANDPLAALRAEIMTPAEEQLKLDEGTPAKPKK